MVDVVVVLAIALGVALVVVVAGALRVSVLAPVFVFALAAPPENVVARPSPVIDRPATSSGTERPRRSIFRLA